MLLIKSNLIFNLSFSCIEYCIVYLHMKNLLYVFLSFSHCLNVFEKNKTCVSFFSSIYDLVLSKVQYQTHFTPLLYETIVTVVNHSLFNVLR